MTPCCQSYLQEPIELPQVQFKDFEYKYLMMMPQVSVLALNTNKLNWILIEDNVYTSFCHQDKKITCL